MVAIRIEITDDSARRGLARLAAAGGNLRPVLGAIGFALRENTLLRFRDSTAPDGGRWAPLSPVTVALRRKGSSKPLLDTGRLRNSITYAVGAKHVDIGTNVKYAGTHQFGARKGAYGKTKRNSPIPWGNVPARPFLGVSRDDEREMSSIIADHVRDAINRR